MRKNNRLLRNYKKIIALALLTNFLKFQVFAERLTGPPPNLSESVTRLYTDSEIDLLIDDLTVAALEAVEQAAGEAARAAFLASVEREAAVLREAARQQAEAQRWRLEAELRQQAMEEAKAANRKKIWLAIGISVVSGLAVGVTGTLLINK